MTPPPLEELLRETLARLGRQEQRTAAIEALLESQPTVLAPTPSPSGVVQTPTGRTTETPNTPRPKRDPFEERYARPPKPDPSPLPSAVSPVTVLASLDEVIWSVSPDGQLVFFTAGAVERLYGLTEHELNNGPGRWLDAAPVEDRERLRAVLARLPEVDTFTLEHRITHTSGGFRWAVTRGKLVRDRDGRPLRVDGLTTDITHQARTRTAIVEVLSSIGPVSGSDFLVKFTQHLCSAFGFRSAVIVEPHPSELHFAHTVAGWVGGARAEPFSFLATSGLTRELLTGGRAFVPVSARERYPTDPLLLHLRAEAIAAEPLIDNHAQLLGFVAVVDDRPVHSENDLRPLLKALAPRAATELVRSRKEAEESELAERLVKIERRARDAEKAVLGSANLAAAGRMAAGLAHDFNNLLGVIAGNADLIRESLPSNDPRRDAAEQISQTAQSIAAMNRKMLAIGKPGPVQVAPLDVANAFRTLEPILHRLTGKRISLNFDLAPGLPFLSADTSQFERVILNLILNARDAIETEGRTASVITVRAALTTIEKGRSGWPADHTPGEYVTITVTDLGCGMPPDVRAKMFDMFFTTKGDRGTGLGLATVHEVVTTARGHIEVESEPGWGTQIRIYWPPMAEPPPLRVWG